MFAELGRGRFDPFHELRRMQDEMNRAFGGARTGVSGPFPPVNVWVGEVGAVLTSEVPGIRSEDLEITVHQNTVTLKGKCDPDETGKDASFHRRERSYGSFSRTVTLPFNVDSDNVEASYKDGILTLRLSRPEAEKPKRIPIN